MKYTIMIKRVYEPYTIHDGFRILVDRLWPRGMSKEKAHLDLWLKEIAPSTELREWFNHDPEKWVEFEKRYRAELKKQDALIQQILEYAHKKPVTLVYAAHDEKHNEAVVLEKYLKTHTT
jgi:uncharacterized protein YeaO (DUF488 family)